MEQSLIANDVELNDIPVEQEPSVLTPDVNVQATKSSIDENILVGSVKEELSELTPNMHQLRLGRSFVTRTEAFTYLKQIDYGELDISLELVKEGTQFMFS